MSSVRKIGEVSIFTFEHRPNARRHKPEFVCHMTRSSRKTDTGTVPRIGLWRSERDHTLSTDSVSSSASRSFGSEVTTGQSRSRARNALCASTTSAFPFLRQSILPSTFATGYVRCTTSVCRNRNDRGTPQRGGARHTCAITPADVTNASPANAASCTSATITG
jgi:hypothetical protein